MEGIKNYNRMAEINAMKGVEKTPDLGLKLKSEPKIEVPETDKKVSNPDNVVSLEAKRAQKEAEKNPDGNNKNTFGKEFKEVEKYVNQTLVPEISNVQTQIQLLEANISSLENSLKFDPSLKSLVEANKAARDHLVKEKAQLQSIVKFYDEYKKHLIAEAYNTKDSLQEEKIAA